MDGGMEMESYLSEGEVVGFVFRDVFFWKPNGSAAEVRRNPELHPSVHAVFLPPLAEP